jgi:uncharacterized membrane protein YdjX (TVP38/TMEM64 family)
MSSAMPIVRKVVFVLFISAIVAAAILLFGTERGQELLSNPHRHGHHIRDWVVAHPYSAPAIYIVLFIVLGVLLLPIWWLEILAGYGFGLTMGVGWSMIASIIAATGAAAMSRFLMAEWFHKRVESHLVRLRQLDERLGHNGLLVVSMVRLAHFIPFGPANAVFGITRVSLRDVALGTLLGGMPTIAILVTTGADRHLLSSWRYWLVVGVVNVVLLGGIVLRYLRPQWFRSIGVE